MDGSDTPATAFAPRKVLCSYSSRDRAQVAPLAALLRSCAHVFIDAADLRPGDRWRERLLEELEACDVFYLFWSKQAAASQEVGWEWRTALARSESDRSPQTIVPVVLDDTPLPADLSARFQAVSLARPRPARLPAFLLAAALLLAMGAAFSAGRASTIEAPASDHRDPPLASDQQRPPKIETPPKPIAASPADPKAPETVTARQNVEARRGGKVETGALRIRGSTTAPQQTLEQNVKASDHGVVRTKDLEIRVK